LNFVFTRHSAVACLAFPVVAACTWNDLPSDVTSAELLSTFCRHLKTHLFSVISWIYPGFLTDLPGH